MCVREQAILVERTQRVQNFVLFQHFVTQTGEGQRIIAELVGKRRYDLASLIIVWEDTLRFRAVCQAKHMRRQEQHCNRIRIRFFSALSGLFYFDLAN